MTLKFKDSKLTLNNSDIVPMGTDNYIDAILGWTQSTVNRMAETLKKVYLGDSPSVNMSSLPQCDSGRILACGSQVTYFSNNPMCEDVEPIGSTVYIIERLGTFFVLITECGQDTYVYVLGTTIEGYFTQLPGELERLAQEQAIWEEEQLEYISDLVEDISEEDWQTMIEGEELPF